VVGGRNGLVAVVDVDRGRVVRRLRGDGRDIYGGSISAAGRLLVTFGTDTVRRWSLPEERPLGVPSWMSTRSRAPAEKCGSRHGL
jgi:hypothetical protein